MRTISACLVYALRTCLIELESIYTDSVLCQHRWAHFITELQSEWVEFILYASTPLLLHCGVAHGSYFYRLLCC